MYSNCVALLACRTGMNSPDVRIACFWASSDAYPPTSACLVTCGEERGCRYEFRPMTGFKKVDGTVLHEWKRSKLCEPRTHSRGTQVSSWVKVLNLSEIPFFPIGHTRADSEFPRRTTPKMGYSDLRARRAAMNDLTQKTTKKRHNIPIAI
jgi:hypothetical protein